MAMIKPVLTLNSYGVLPVSDATNDIYIYFTSNGSDQITQNRTIITLNSDGTTIYDNITQSLELKAKIPANTLSNGVAVNVKVAVGNINNVFSNFSDQAILLPLSPGTFTFSNITGGIVNAASYNFQLTYSQLQNENLQSYRFYLYDSNQNLLSSSNDILYAQDNSLAYTFAGLQDSTKYYIQAIGVTQHYMIIDSGKIEFTANYISPRLNAVLTATNLPQKGAVSIQANIYQIIGYSSDGSTINYINNEEADLSTGQTVYWQEGFGIDGNFTMKIWVRDIQLNKNFITLYSAQGKIIMYYDGTQIVLKKIINNIEYYYITSNAINVTSSNDKVFIFVQNFNSTQLMNLQAEIIN